MNKYYYRKGISRIEPEQKNIIITSATKYKKISNKLYQEFRGILKQLCTSPSGHIKFLKTLGLSALGAFMNLIWPGQCKTVVTDIFADINIIVFVHYRRCPLAAGIITISNYSSFTDFPNARLL